jgi:putative methionine-R-sulfoxide reductase with GAF domain
MIVETAAGVIGARAGSLFLIDFGRGELVFEVAIGPEADQIEGFRMPMTQGIAGLVATSGQPMAISDARDNPKVFKEIGDRVKHHAESILCVPLIHGDRVIGVFEMLDKIGAPSFNNEDMQILGMFASEAAIAIELSRTYRHVMPLMIELPKATVVHGQWEPGVPAAAQRVDVLLGLPTGEAYLTERVGPHWYEQYDGEKPLIVGHHDYGRTRQPLVHADRVYAIDTGCVYGGRLTAVILPEFRFVSVPAREDYWASFRAAHERSDLC